MPQDTPRANVVECEQTGAHVTLMAGLITDCGAEVARRKEAEGWFDVSTLKEPYRIEGKKTLGYELAEQFRWGLPDVIVYPDRRRHGSDRYVESVRRNGTPGLDRFQTPANGDGPGRRLCSNRARVSSKESDLQMSFPNAATVAAACECPGRLDDFLIIDALRESGGTAIAVSDDE